MKKVISHIGAREYEWTFNDDGTCLCNGKAAAIEMRSVSRNRVSVIADGSSFDAAVTSNGSSYDVLLGGEMFRVDVETPSSVTARQLNSLTHRHNAGVEVRSPMPGMVVRLEVSEGSKVDVGDGLVILEAMKMENEIRAKSKGTVAKIAVSEKQIVDKGQLLLVIQ